MGPQVKQLKLTLILNSFLINYTLIFNQIAITNFRTCIESYRVKLCQENYEDKICYEKQILPENETVDDIVANLKMCSVYSLDVYPLYRKTEIRTKSTKFKTKSPVQNPKNVKISLDAANDKVKFEWEPVSCCSGYKVIQKLQDSESSSADWTFLTDKPELIIPAHDPCTKLRLV